MITITSNPVVGVSCNFFHADPERPLYKNKVLQYVEEKLVLAIVRAGGLAIMLPDLQSEALDARLIDLIDGLVLGGGADVSPQTYGEHPLDPAWGGDPVRDRYERRLVDTAIACGRPVLGVCRGAQLLNAASGGTLYQDIKTHYPTTPMVHRDWHRYDLVEHDVKLATGSWIASVYGQSQLLVNTAHHQCIKTVAPGFVPSAWAPDGIVEGIECIDRDRFIVGVQWHPEWLDDIPEASPQRASGQPIFAAFIETCATKRANRTAKERTRKET